MECQACGHSSADEGARFCSQCGAELGELADRVDPIAVIDGAVEAFEAGELQRALDALDEQLDRAEAARDEITLIYLLDVSRQMVQQLDEGEFENLEQLVSDANEALRSVQAGRLSPSLELARKRFAEGDHPAALELLNRELTDAPTHDDETARLEVWRVFAVAAEMVDALDTARASFEQLRASAAHRLGAVDEVVDSDIAEPQDFEELDELDEGEQESVLEPFETPNPWLQKLFAMPAYGRVPVIAVSLLREVSPDSDERLLAAIKVMHGRLRSGYLLATTKWLRWIGTFPMRQDDFWSYEYKVEYEGMGLGLTRGVIILASGHQFQTWSSRGKRFVQMYSVIQQAMSWEASNTGGNVVGAWD
jgi:tetratricopeptide (TPR) repeat protein